MSIYNIVASTDEATVVAEYTGFMLLSPLIEKKWKRWE
jgi:hypothetical protein